MQIRNMQIRNMQISKWRPRRRQHLTVPYHNMAKTRCEDEEHSEETENKTDRTAEQHGQTRKQTNAQTHMSEANKNNLAYIHYLTRKYTHKHNTYAHKHTRVKIRPGKIILPTCP